MLANWIHIVIVHLAVIGTPYLAYRIWTHRDQSMDAASWRASFTGLIVLNILTAIAYFTGPEAAEWTKVVLEPFPQDHVEDHALWGRISWVVQGVTGLLAIMGWASIWQEEVPDRRIGPAIIFLLALNTFLIVYTAHLGGMIRRMDLLVQ